MAYPVLDTFSDADGTLISGSGTSVSGNNTTRTSDSGSSSTSEAGTLTALDVYEIRAGQVYNKTAGAGVSHLLYNDNPAAVHSTTVAGVFNFYTSGHTSQILLTIHRYFALRYVPSTGVYTVIDLITGNPIGAAGSGWPGSCSGARHTPSR